MNNILLLLLVTILVIGCNAFMNSASYHHRSRVSMTKTFSLPESVIQRLDELKSQYDAVSSLDDPTANAEKEKLEEIVQKYQTYKEVRWMMIKLKNMYKGEASEQRKSRQLKSFIDLFKGRLELEEIIKEKLGLPYNKTIPEIKELLELAKIDEQIVSLKSQLQAVEVKLPEGKSTREERFGY